MGVALHPTPPLRSGLLVFLIFLLALGWGARGTWRSRGGSERQTVRRWRVSGSSDGQECLEG